MPPNPRKPLTEKDVDYLMSGRSLNRTVIIIYAMFTFLIILVIYGSIVSSQPAVLILTIPLLLLLFFFVWQFKSYKKAETSPHAVKRIEQKIHIVKRNFCLLEYVTILPLATMGSFFITLTIAGNVHVMSDIVFVISWALIAIALFKLISKIMDAWARRLVK